MLVEAVFKRHRGIFDQVYSILIMLLSHYGDEIERHTRKGFIS
jgi:hypothetical protein